MNKYLKFCKSELEKDSSLIRAELIRRMVKFFKDELENYTTCHAEADFNRDCAPHLTLVKSNRGGGKSAVSKNARIEEKIFIEECDKLRQSNHFSSASELAISLRRSLAKRGIHFSTGTLRGKITKFKLFKK